MSCEKLKQVLEAAPGNKCFTTVTNAKERGKRFSFENKNKKSICRVHVDGCFITDNSIKKCDYLFFVNEIHKYYLIELKGVHVSEAVEQIVSTYHIINEKIKSNAQNYKGVIVSSSVPSATQQKFRKLQEQCLKELGLKIIKTHILHVEKI